ncbi:hypothetical protein D9M73_191490 [compost metagenome]
MERVSDCQSASLQTHGNPSFERSSEVEVSLSQPSLAHPEVQLPTLPASIEGQLLADFVEKVAPLSGLRQNLRIGQQGRTQHDGTVIEWAGTAVLLVQSRRSHPNQSPTAQH